jgi:hypothetical protein
MSTPIAGHVAETDTEAREPLRTNPRFRKLLEERA